jgi:beta-glucanase (GH16 family)
MRKLFSLMLLACCPLIWFGCGGSEDAPKVTPTNVTLSADVSDDGTGLVTFTATADNAVKFYYYYGESDSDPAVLSEDGKGQYTYAATGSYNVRVIAFSADNMSADKSISVDVEVAISDEGYSTPDTYDGMTLSWNDEFSGSTVNTDFWKFETGNNGGWGNNELEYYQSNNAKVKDGYLIISAKKESVGGQLYSSTRMTTQGKQEYEFGRVDIRAILPKGQGIWPALWGLGTDIGTVGWPKCGEIDIMEMIGGSGREKTVYGTPHWWDTDAIGHASAGGHYDLSSGTFADKFHVFSLIWTADVLQWYVDDVKYWEIDITPANAPERFDEFRHNYFFIFNVAVGGAWPGNPDSSTKFPQLMVVDYIRVFQPL